MLSLFAVFALVAYVSAQSSGCTSALTTIALNPDAAACLNTPTLISIVAGGNSSASIVPQIDTWLQGLCGAPACSNETLAAVVSNVTAGCSEDLSTDLGDDSIAGITSLIQQYYPTARKIVCLQDGEENCVTKTLQAVEGKLGTLSTASILSGDFLTTASQVITTDAKELACTDCIKAAYNVLVEDIPQLISTDLKAQAEAQCGANFTDGQNPANIKAVSATSTQDDSEGAAAQNFSAFYIALAASSVAIVSTAYAFLL